MYGNPSLYLQIAGIFCPFQKGFIVFPAPFAFTTEVLFIYPHISIKGNTSHGEDQRRPNVGSHILRRITFPRSGCPSVPLQAKPFPRTCPLFRIIFCDAEAADAEYMAPEDIAGRVEITRWGGTILQLGVDALRKGKKDLLITGPYWSSQTDI